MKIPFAVTLCFAFAAHAAAFTKSGTVYSTDGSSTDVQAAIYDANAGDTVNIPAGTFTWGANNTSVYVTKAITLQGAGKANTTIVMSTSGPAYGGAAISIGAAATVKSFSISSPSGTDNRTPLSAGSSNGWRVTDINYTQSGTQGYFMYIGGVYGLIDNCQFTGGSGSSELIFMRGPNDSWQTASSMGTANAVYIEDCAFNKDCYVCDANSNARVVVRFCTVTWVIKVDAHGKASNSPPRGVRQTEAYNNHWTGNGLGGAWPALELRGGTGMVFDNTNDDNTSAIRGFMKLNEYGCLATWPNFGSFQTPVNYPVDDQIGTGMDPKTGGAEPMYLWNNLKAGDPMPFLWDTIPSAAISLYQSQTGNSSATFALQDIIKPDRDYFAQGTTFNGTTGVGRGTRAQMNAITPTKTGVGFWVTDEGTWNNGSASSGRLYVWNGSAWVLKYTPFTYPHPLRGGSPATLPAPINLRVLGHA